MDNGNIVKWDRGTRSHLRRYQIFRSFLEIRLNYRCNINKALSYTFLKGIIVFIYRKSIPFGLVNNID